MVKNEGIAEGCELTHIADERSEQLDVIPQMTFCVVHIRKKYACKQCEETIQTAKLPKQPIPKSMASADETTLQVLNEKNKKATIKSYMWLFIGGPPELR